MLDPCTESSGAFFVMKPKEIWRDVVGYEGLYMVSNYGTIKGLSKRMYGHILSPARNSKGYRYVCLYKDGLSRCVKVYRIVAMAFIPNPGNLPEIDHMDGSRDNDCAWNLRWVTHKQNANNPITRKRLSIANSGENNSFYGKRHSDETRARLSLIRKGTCTGSRNPMYGVRRCGYESPNHHEVVQYTKDGVFVREWSCAAEAESSLNIAHGKITSVCRHYNGRKTAGGYKWEYKNR